MELFFPPGRARTPTVVAWLVGIVSLLALAHRFRMGTDVTDESFSIAMPYRYVLGDRPFVEEISIQQTAGLVLYPFVWLFVKISGGSTGLVLFVRGVHFVVFKGLAALGTFLGARRWLKSQATAIALAFLPVAFVPHSIPNVGYNVIGSSLLVAGSFLGVAAFAEESGRTRHRLYFASGFCQGVMALAYPPMVAAAVLSAVLVVVCAPRERLKAFGVFALGGIAVVLLTLPALHASGIAGVRRSLSWGVQANEAHGRDRLVWIFVALRTWAPPLYAVAAGVTFVAGIVRARAFVVAVVGGAAMYLVLSNPENPDAAIPALQLVIYAGLFAPFLLPAARPDGLVFRGAVLVWIPAVAAGVAAGFTSTQGPNAAALGLDAAMVLSATLAARALEQSSDERILPMLPAFALTTLLVIRCYGFVYRDAPLVQLTETVKTGPYKGLLTTPERARIFTEFSSIVRTYDNPDGRLLYLYEDPGFYLFSRMRPGAHSVWEAARGGDVPGMLAFWETVPKGHGIVVRMKGAGTSAADAIVAPPDRKIHETPHFVVYRDQ